MAVTLDEIENFIKNEGLKYDRKDDEIVLISSDDESTYYHRIKLQENGNIFKWQMNPVDGDDALKIKDHKYQKEVLMHLLNLNYITKFGTWEYDPDDGETRLVVEIPLEDAKMTQKQFHRISGYMFIDGDRYTDQILEILKTGKFKNSSDNDATIAKLEAMLAQLKNSSDSDGI